MTWRDHDKNDDRRRGGPRAIASVLADVVARLGLERSLDDYRVWDAWDEVVGATVARNARPIRLDGPRLVVAVKSNTWMQELTMLRGDITGRLNEWMGRKVVGEIFLVVGRVDALEPARQRLPAHTAPVPKRASDELDRLWKRRRDNDA